MLPKQLDSDDLLEIYALFKQATVGDINTGKITCVLFRSRYNGQQNRWFHFCHFFFKNSMPRNVRSQGKGKMECMEQQKRTDQRSSQARIHQQSASSSCQINCIQFFFDFISFGKEKIRKRISLIQLLNVDDISFHILYETK